MAEPLSENDVITCKLGSYFDGQAGINVLHYRVRQPATGFITDLEAATALDNLFALPLQNLMTNGATYYGVRVQKIYPGLVTLGQVAANNSGAGGAGNTPMPTQCTGMITKLTNFAGRQFRGRIYLPFPDNSDNDPVLNRPTAGYMTRLGFFASAMTQDVNVVGAFGTNIISPVIWNVVPQTNGLITGATARQKWATQRRRGDYGRLNPFPPF